MIGSHGFAPRLEILPPAQRLLWDALGAIPSAFVLYGGTALALHLGHRQSVDFDFFGDERFEPGALFAAIPLLAGARITRQAPDTLGVIVDRGGPVRLSFFGLPGLARLRPACIAPGNGVRVAALLDLAGTKAAVVQQRAEAKDYIDIDSILMDGRIDLPTALAAARAIYGDSFNPLLTLKALSWFADGDLHRLSGETRDRLAAAAREVDPLRLPVLGPDGSAP
ncbi:MAG: nucleotidyl transferase AbiEii/AbiGii toxin family protein [Rhodospirillales bacterium]|nr:nucleotidyl transferase AbiEii/AbiGii toxin family protein [Rhodospirillales bacterium]